jgi:hypothetical protein
MNTAQPNGTTGGTIPWRTPLVVLIAGAIVVLRVPVLRCS